MSEEIRIRPAGSGDLDGKEWFVANGLSGYAAGSVAGTPNRRHDGLLVAALEDPWGRVVMLDRLDETVHCADGTVLALTAATLEEFRLELGLPVWRFSGPAGTVERRVAMVHGQNTVCVLWRLETRNPGAARIEVAPWCHCRAHDGSLDQPLHEGAVTLRAGGRIEIAQAPYPPLRMALEGAGFRAGLDLGRRIEAVYPAESARDYADRGPLWSPGVVSVAFSAGGEAALMASAESWPVALALSASQAWEGECARRRRLIAAAHPALRQGAAALGVLAADAFLFAPRGREVLRARVGAEGGVVRSAIAGYPWFNDWGRDAMIALEGLTLATGRGDMARAVLLLFGGSVRDGLIPANIPDGAAEGVYRAVDATLWFFYALDRTVRATGDQELLDRLMPVLIEILDHFRRGTRFGIGVDAADGLLTQGVGLPWDHMLTWMDSDTPRHGKAVEINALWYNALCLMEGWLRERGDEAAAARAGDEARRVRDSFNRKFWNPETGFLFDVLVEDGVPCPENRLSYDQTTHYDPAWCWSNQILAVGLPHPVLAREHWAAVVTVVRDRLLTPVGLRTLDPASPAYRPCYAGDLHARDRAYHRGTVWPWLLGPFVDAWLAVWPDDRAGARRVLDGLAAHLGEGALGTIAEVFDGDPPHTPRGCFAQAWSVGEWLRAWVKTAG